MTVATGHEAAERAAAVPSPADPAEPAAVPRLADGVELLGEYQNSGYRSRRRWSGGPTARSSRCPRCCTS